MTVKVGDKVLITHTDYSEVSSYGVGDIQLVMYVSDDGRVLKLGEEWFTFYPEEVEPIAATIAAQIRARMEEHMGKGEYVRAVKWAQLAEQAEELENE